MLAVAIVALLGATYAAAVGDGREPYAPRAAQTPHERAPRGGRAVPRPAAQRLTRACRALRVEQDLLRLVRRRPGDADGLL